MLLLTNQAKIVCKHRLGVVANAARQDWVTVNGAPLLVESDPEGRPISGCPNMGATIKPCQRTLKVRNGYSDLIRIDGRRACLDSLSGLTDGTPPGVVPYVVQRPGQDFVAEAP